MSRSRKLSWLLSVDRASRLLQRGSISVWDLVQYCHERAQWGEEDWGLNAMDTLIDIDQLKEDCQRSQQYIDDGNPRSILEGLPITLKSNMALSHVPLTASSNILHTTTNGGYNCDVAHQLIINAGSICLGTTTMDEFGMGSLGTNAYNHSRPSKNPLPYLFQQQQQQQQQVEEEEDDEVWVQRILTRPKNLSASDDDDVDDDDVLEDWVVGGSSCGAAASVALGSSLVAMGTDTGGSVRLPAAWCSIVGFKPSYGTYSRHGIVSYASSLDTVGILTPTVQCASHVHNTLTHNTHKNHDPTTYIIPPTTQTIYTKTTDNNNNEEDTITIGIPTSFSIKECPMYVRQAWEKAAQQLSLLNTHHHNTKKIKIITIDNDQLSMELIQHSLAAYYVLACAEASSNLSRYDGLRYGPPHDSLENDEDSSSISLLEQQYSQYRAKHFGTEVIRRLLCGTSVLSSDRFHTHYEAATKVRSMLTQQFHHLLSSPQSTIDAILIPTTIQRPPPLLSNTNTTDAMANDIMTVPISLAGLPSISIPIYANDKDDMSVGIQIVGAKFSETFILQLAHSLQQSNHPLQ